MGGGEGVRVDGLYRLARRSTAAENGCTAFDASTSDPLYI
eukprot:COSAG02_NODE_68327_length_251_cov_0.460526_1_plen_39_part_10